MLCSAKTRHTKSQGKGVYLFVRQGIPIRSEKYTHRFDRRKLEALKINAFSYAKILKAFKAFNAAFCASLAAAPMLKYGKKGGGNGTDSGSGPAYPEGRTYSPRTARRKC